MAKIKWTDSMVTEYNRLVARGCSATDISKSLPMTTQQIYTYERRKREKIDPVIVDKNLRQPVINEGIKQPPHISAAIHFNKEGCRLTKANGYLQLDGKRISYGQVIDKWKAEVK